MNVFDMAMGKELEVKAYYEKIVSETSEQGIKTIFSLLAGDEQKHFDAIEAMKKGADVGALADSLALDTARNVLQGLAGAKDVAAKLHNDLESYRFALKVEAESVRFYEGMLEKVADERQKAILEKILAEEKNHYNIVENLFDFVLKPEYYLAWAEFSNLKEF